MEMENFVLTEKLGAFITPHIWVTIDFNVWYLSLWEKKQNSGFLKILFLP